MMNDIYNDYICNCPKEINEKIFLEYQNKIEGILTLFEKVGK